MITNCTKCNKAVVVLRKEYHPRKRILCKKCNNSGWLVKVVATIKGFFSPRPQLVQIG